MSGDKDRQQRDLDLMRKSYLALEAEQNSGGSSEPLEREAVGRRALDRGDQDDVALPADEDDVIMYRGRPVRRGNAGTPGSSTGKPKQFRGADGNGSRRRSSDSGKSVGVVGIDKIKQALATLTDMYDDGLITRAEFDAKRRQLLDRL